MGEARQAEDGGGGVSHLHKNVTSKWWMLLTFVTNFGLDIEHRTHVEHATIAMGCNVTTMLNLLFWINSSGSAVAEQF